MWQRRFRNAFHYISHPVAAWPANHPNYFLLGFSAALAPKFHPAGCFPTVIGTPMLEIVEVQESPGEPSELRRAQEAHLRYQMCRFVELSSK